MNTNLISLLVKYIAFEISKTKPEYIYIYILSLPQVFSPSLPIGLLTPILGMRAYLIGKALDADGNLVAPDTRHGTKTGQGANTDQSTSNDQGRKGNKRKSGDQLGRTALGRPGLPGSSLPSNEWDAANPSNANAYGSQTGVNPYALPPGAGSGSSANYGSTPGGSGPNDVNTPSTDFYGNQGMYDPVRNIFTGPRLGKRKEKNFVS